jgi:hypothetical protein
MKMLAYLGGAYNGNFSWVDFVLILIGGAVFFIYKFFNPK